MPNGEALMLKRPGGRSMDSGPPAGRGPLSNSDFINNSLARFVEMKKGGKCVGPNIAPNTVHRLKEIAWRTLRPIDVVGTQMGNSVLRVAR
jgi:hypothetical protein